MLRRTVRHASLRAAFALSALLAGCTESGSPSSAAIDDASEPADSTSLDDASAQPDADASTTLDADWWPDATPGAERIALVLTTGGGNPSSDPLYRIGLDDRTIVRLADVPTPTPYAWASSMTAFGDRVFVLMGDEVLVYDVGNGSLRARWSTGASTPPKFARVCGGLLWVSLTASHVLAGYDPTIGTLAHGIDLSAWADLEADTMVAAGDRLFVALTRANGDARVVAIDCTTRTIARGWTTPSSTTLHPNHHAPTEPYVMGIGTVYRLAPDADALTGPIVTETAVGSESLVGMATSTGSKILVGGVSGGHQSSWITTRLACLDVATSAIASTPPPTWPQSGEIVYTLLGSSRSGIAFVAAGPELKGTGPRGIVVYDVERCAGWNLDSAQWLLSGEHGFIAATFL